MEQGSVSDFKTSTTSVQAGNGGGIGTVSIAPRASPEVSEIELSSKQGHRHSIHRMSSNGSDNIVNSEVKLDVNIEFV